MIDKIQYLSLLHLKENNYVTLSKGRRMESLDKKSQ